MCRAFLAAILISLVTIANVPLARANMAPPLHEFTVGISVMRVAEGLRITALDKAGHGEKASLKVGDIILAIEGRYAKTMTDDDIKSFSQDTHVYPVDLIVLRGDDVRVVEVA